MDPDEFPTIDSRLAAMGWTYDTGDEEVKDRHGQRVEWEHVLTLLPDFELDEVEAWFENLNDKDAWKRKG